MSDCNHDLHDLPAWAECPLCLRSRLAEAEAEIARADYATRRAVERLAECKVDAERAAGAFDATALTLRRAKYAAEARLAEEERSAREWKEAALSLGERLSLVGPTSYYSFAPFQWLDWAVAAIDAHLSRKQP